MDAFIFQLRKGLTLGVKLCFKVPHLLSWVRELKLIS